MLGLNRILLATDFSASATAALLYAAALTRLSHATLQVLHVLDTRVTALARWTDVFHSTEVFAAKIAEETTALQELLAHPALTGLAVEQLVRQGHPADHIIDLAAQGGSRGDGRARHHPGLGKNHGQSGTGGCAWQSCTSPPGTGR